ncbi:MAG TPA: ABC transporter substrate-binding protein/permease [Planctomicrobium sp.]|nr:ABC transporter substrate-binding protein/permease [Planctomicrobium sp.]
MGTTSPDGTRNRLVRFCLLLGAITLFPWCDFATAGDGLEKVRKRGTLIWGADQEGGGPFVYPAEDDPNRLEGFEVELAQILAESLGVRSQFQQGQWDKLPDLLTRGDIDIVLNGYEWTPIRAERYGASIPYYIYELQLLGRQNDSTLKSWDDLFNPPDGKKKRVAILGGSAAQDYLEKFLGNRVEIANFDGVSDAMRAVELNADGIDANLQDLPIWTFYQGGFPQLTAIGDPVGRGFYVALTRKEDPELLQAINTAIFSALQDGRLRRVLAKYRMWNDTQSLRGLETNPQGCFVGMTTNTNENEAEAEQSYISVRGFSVVQQRGWLLVKAAGMTVVLAATAMPLAILIGLMMALFRLYGPWFLRIPATMYVELIRGTPLVLQLYVLFFLLPEIGITVNAFWAAVAGLALNYSAYEAEIYRAGLQAIPHGQMEAAQSLGFSQALALRRIIIPQATRIVIPPVTNDFIALFKDTAVCSVITVVELSKEYYIQARSTGAILELGLLTALLYLAMSYPLSLVAGRLEKRLMAEKRT